MTPTARNIVASCIVAALLGSGACSRTTSSRGEFAPGPVVTRATAAQNAALIDRIKSLAGTWESTDEKGVAHISSVYSVSSSGSVVRQIMLPGSPHEMTNMYHMDGPSMVMVHYCAMGNQPHLRATATGSTPDRIELKSDGVTNRTAADQPYMAQLTIIFKDADHIREEWRTYENGSLGSGTNFDLARRK